MKVTRREFLKTALISAAGLWRSTLPVHPPIHSDAPNVILLVFDSFSARHLSLLGYPRLTTPNLQEFAEKATVYHRHYAGGNFTSPSTASLLTGVYPWTHRAIQQGGLIDRDRVAHNLFSALESTYTKVAFAQNVWGDLFLQQFKPSIDIHLKSTAFSLENDIRYNDAFGESDALASFRAFDDFLEQDYGLPGSLYFSLFDKIRSYLAKAMRPAALSEEYPLGIPTFLKYKLYFLLKDVFQGVMNEILALQQPFVGYFHFWTPHEPYTPERRFLNLFHDDWIPPSKPAHPWGAHLPEQELHTFRREYDQYVANLDAEFGVFYRALRNAGILENSYVLVTADHGQYFERGVHGHGTPLLYDPVIHIPLIISAPGQTARQDVYSVTSCVDVLPTILKMTGADQPAYLEGTPLPGFGDDHEDKPVFAVEARTNSSFGPLSVGTFTMIHGDYKLIWYRGYAGYEDMYELYNLKTDPEELDDLSSSHPGLAQQMAAQLSKKLAESDLY